MLVIWDVSIIGFPSNVLKSVDIKNIMDVKEINLDNTNINTCPRNNFLKAWTKLMKLGMNKLYPKEYKIDYYLKNNEIINKYGIKLKIISLKGHTTGSIGIKYKDYLFVGDALVNRGSKVSIAFQNQHPIDAVKSIKKITEDDQPKKSRSKISTARKEKI